ncbi:non-ribosomal peptide synthetase, partial [Streptomyces durbertensis]
MKGVIMDGNRKAEEAPGTRGAARPAPRAELTARPDERGPLSYGQQRLWFLDRWLGSNAVYNIPVTLRLTGPLDADRLVAAVTVVAGRHEVLYTVFEEDRHGQPRQRLLDSREPHCVVVDLTPLPADTRAAHAREAVEADARRPFDLAKDPMLRMALYRLAEDEHWLQLTFHHIACDGWSLDVFERQLREAYASGAGRPAEPLPVQYADYALWQRDALDGPRTERALRAWEDALDGAPDLLDLGLDRPRPAELTYRGETTDFPLDDLSSSSLEAFAAAENVSLYTVLLAAFQVLAARHSGSDDIVVGSPTAGRGNARLNDLVGFFVDTLVLRTDLSGAPSFRELVRRTHRSLLNALSRSKAPFDLAVKRLHPERSLSHNPIVQTLFAFHEEEPPTPFAEGVSVERSMTPTGTAKFDLTWSIYRRPDGMLLQVEYATDLFDAATVGSLVDHWRVLLGGILAEPDTPIDRLSVMDATERSLLAEWAGAGARFPVSAVHEAVVRRAVEVPGEVAVVCGGESLSYGELVVRAG